jgi:putative DNA-invertase from lambdoid prophage Rac
VLPLDAEAVRTRRAKVDEGNSLGSQQRRLESVCQSLFDKPLDQFISEEGVSGSIPLSERRAVGPMLADLQRGDIVIACKLDRLGRSALDSLNLVREFQDRGIGLRLLDLGSDDVTGNGVGRMFLTILASVAEFERDRIRERILDSKDQCKALGLYRGGLAPFGFRPGEPLERRRARPLVEHPEEQLAIEKIISMRRRGRTLRQISASLAKTGISLSHEGCAAVLRAAAQSKAA